MSSSAYGQDSGDNPHFSDQPRNDKGKLPMTTSTLAQSSDGRRLPPLDDVPAEVGSSRNERKRQRIDDDDDDDILVDRFCDLQVEVRRDMELLPPPGGLWLPLGAFRCEPPPSTLAFYHISYEKVVEWLQLSFGADGMLPLWILDPTKEYDPALAEEDVERAQACEVSNEFSFWGILGHIDKRLRQTSPRGGLQLPRPGKIVLNLGGVDRIDRAPDAVPQAVSLPMGSELPVLMEVESPQPLDVGVPSPPVLVSPSSMEVELSPPAQESIAVGQDDQPAGSPPIERQTGESSGGFIDLTLSSPEPDDPPGSSSRQSQDRGVSEDAVGMHGVSPARENTPMMELGAVPDENVLQQWADEEGPLYAAGNLAGAGEVDYPNSPVPPDEQDMPPFFEGEYEDEAGEGLDEYEDGDGVPGDDEELGLEDGSLAGHDIHEKLALTFPQDTDRAVQDFLTLFNLGNEYKPTDRVTVYGCKVPVYAYQAFGVVWLLTRPAYIQDLYGAIIADGTGLGKTLLALLGCVISNQLRLRYNRIMEARETLQYGPGGHGGHLPANAGEQEQCHVHDHIGLQCPCKPGSISERIAARTSDGVSLFLVPPNVIGSWVDAIHKFLVLTEDDEDCLRPHITSSASYTDPRAPRLPYGTLRSLIVEPTSSITPAGPGSKARRIWTLHPEQGQSRYLFVVAKGTMLTKTFVPAFHPPKPVTQKDKAAGKPISFWLAPGRIVIDEQHQVTNKNTHIMKFLGDQRDRCLGLAIPTTMWFLTATPMDRGPGDIESTIRLLEKPAWNTISHPLFGLTSKEFKKLITQYQAIEKADAEEQAAVSKQYVARASKLLQPLIIRRTRTDTFMGQPILPTPLPVHSYTIEVETEEGQQVAVDRLTQNAKDNVRVKLANLVAQWQAGGRSGPQPTIHNILRNMSTLNIFFLLRIAANFPEIVNDKFKELVLRATDLSPFVGDGSTEAAYNLGHPFLPILPDIVRGSAKMEKILSLVDKSLADNTMPIPTAQDPNPTIMPKKSVIVSHSPASAQIAAYWLRRKRPGLKVVLLTAGSSGARRREIEQQFEMYEGPGEPMRGAQVLVSSTKLIGTGLNLSRANYLILMDLEWLVRDQEQARGRIARLGQRHHAHIYQLLNKDSQAECMIHARQTKRHELVEQFWGEGASNNAEIEIVEVE